MEKSELLDAIAASCDGIPGSAVVAGELAKMFGYQPLILILREELRGSDLHILYNYIMLPAWKGENRGALWGVYGVLETPGEARKRINEFREKD